MSTRPETPDLVVLRGAPDDEELAALVTVFRLLAVPEADPVPRRTSSLWGNDSAWRVTGWRAAG